MNGDRDPHLRHLAITAALLPAERCLKHCPKATNTSKTSWGCLSNSSARIHIKAYRGETLRTLVLVVEADPAAVPVSGAGEMNNVGLLTAQTN